MMVPHRLVVSVVIAAFTIAGCGAGSTASVADLAVSPSQTVLATATSSSAEADDRSVGVTSSAGSAAAVLADLRVAGRGPKTGYSRDDYGPAWADVDRNGCDTRNDILDRDLTNKQLKAGTGNCVILNGTLDDPYTATRIDFERGGASEVDIDHVVALGNSWVTGAAPWPYAKKVAFANDPLNLLAVGSSANRQKGDGDAATWLPPNKRFRCSYVAAQVGVKDKYGLYVTPAEKSAMQDVLKRCPGENVPTGGGPTKSDLKQPAAPESSAAPKPPNGSRSDPQFESCKAAKAAGYGPYVQGKDSEYGWYRDGDSDGTACE